jgi:UDPglucose 6-dehydrogenase
MPRPPAPRDLAIVGTGYAGLVTAVALAKQRNRVVCVDIDPHRVEAVSRGRAPFFEPGLDEALAGLVRSGRLTATTDLASAVRASEATFICVGTPSAPDGSFDLSQVERASRAIGVALRGDGGGRGGRRRDRHNQHHHVVVTKSTVAPTQNRTVVLPALEAASGMVAPRDLSLASNPEFLREGSALADALHPDRVVVGTMEGDSRARRFLDALLRPARAPILHTSLEGAELVKLASNAMLATRVAFANEVANLASAVGADGDEVLRGVGMDRRVGPDFLRAGAGFGGSCFPKDLRALVAFSEDRGVGMVVPAAALEQNDVQPLVVVELARRALGGALEGRRVALLGLSFKAGTDDVRETRALPIYRALLEAGARVVCHDPMSGAAFAALAASMGLPRPRLARSLEAALRGSDAAVLQAGWPQYTSLGPEALIDLMGDAPVVVDGRRALDPARMRKAGIRYYGIGWPA